MIYRFGFGLPFSNLISFCSFVSVTRKPVFEDSSRRYRNNIDNRTRFIYLLLANSVEPNVRTEFMNK